MTEPLSPFASSNHILDRLVDTSTQIKVVAARPTTAERNANQLVKCMSFFDLLLAELADAPAGEKLNLVAAAFLLISR